MVENNTKEVWRGMQKIVGYRKKNKLHASPALGCEFADELNKYYARFDIHDLENEQDTILCSGNFSDSVDTTRKPVTLEVEDVCRQLKRINVNKSAGPDGIKPKVLYICAEQLCKIFHTLFCRSLSLGKIPSG